MADNITIFKMFSGLLNGTAASFFGTHLYETLKKPPEAGENPGTPSTPGEEEGREEKTASDTGTESQINVRQFLCGPGVTEQAGNKKLLVIGQHLPAPPYRETTAVVMDRQRNLHVKALEIFHDSSSNGLKVSLMDHIEAAGIVETLSKHHVAVFGRAGENVFLDAFYCQWKKHADIVFQDGAFVHRCLGEERQSIEDTYPQNSNDAESNFYGAAFRFLNPHGYTRTLIYALELQYIVPVISALVRRVGHPKSHEERDAMCGPGGTAMIIRGQKKLRSGMCLHIELNQ